MIYRCKKTIWYALTFPEPKDLMTFSIAAMGIALQILFLVRRKHYKLIKENIFNFHSRYIFRWSPIRQMTSDKAIMQYANINMQCKYKEPLKYQLDLKIAITTVSMNTLLTFLYWRQSFMPMEAYHIIFTTMILHTPRKILSTIFLFIKSYTIVYFLKVNVTTINIT